MECIVCLEEKEIVKFDCKHYTCADCLEHIKDHNESKCPMCRVDICINGVRIRYYTFFEAVEHGDLDSMKWLLENDYSDDFDLDVFDEAVRRGNFEIIKWLKENNCPWDEETFTQAIYQDDLELIKWFHSNGCPWNERIFGDAVERGDLNIIKWLKENGCPWDENVFIDSISGEKLEIMEWLKENGCPWSENVFDRAAHKHISLEIIQWLHFNGCPWDEHTLKLIEKTNNSECIRWAREHCPKKKRMSIAEKNLEVLQNLPYNCGLLHQ